jgi:hypothetical protein
MLSGLSVIVVSLISIYHNVDSYSMGPQLYKAKEYEEVPRKLRKKLMDIGIWDSLPPTSFDIHLLADEWLEAIYLITFRTKDDGYWSFAEKYAKVNRDKFFEGQVKTTIPVIIKGPETYGISQEEFPWKVNVVKNGKYYERISCFVFVDEDENAVYMCLWEPSGGTIDI